MKHSLSTVGSTEVRRLRRVSVTWVLVLTNRSLTFSTPMFSDAPESTIIAPPLACAFQVIHFHALCLWRSITFAKCQERRIGTDIQGNLEHNAVDELLSWNLRPDVVIYHWLYQSGRSRMLSLCVKIALFSHDLPVELPAFGSKRRGIGEGYRNRRYRDRKYYQVETQNGVRYANALSFLQATFRIYPYAATVFDSLPSVADR
ncbi:hypothetical protein FPV67DRAFT_1096535 [Lyophyllum atratum]|nr:hypothetical protein FPV67DRAFT_1096535 [Lyophyllum atratum]